ncbi:type II secretion system protein [Ideonella paludis]|uniref:Type II secretion system protein n=1 Tax=Ideonella paludis TaxID=1233411 RepID=A0ABS5E454_9BURK|nr:hypothetical protein [Ideonella paludis]MBQ0937821.1 hypothetical protein [Ideonella paludis]
MRHINRYRTQSGVTLVEASIALACFGLLMILIIAMVQRQDAQSRMVIQDSAVHRAQAAITAYAAMHSRLPCPADNADLATGGTENCGITEGYLPVKTLGLPLPVAAQMRYRVVAKELQQVNSFDAKVLATTGLDILKTMTAMPVKSFTGNAGAVGVKEQNFCETLANLVTATNQAAHTAYSLLPEADLQHQDRALHTSGSSLWAALNCTQVRAHALRANANVLASMEFLTQSYNDRMKVWTAELASFNLDAVAATTQALQGSSKIFRQTGNTLAAVGVVSCPYCAPSGVSLPFAAAATADAMAAQGLLMADAAIYHTRAGLFDDFLARPALATLGLVNTTTWSTSDGYKKALNTGARY